MILIDIDNCISDDSWRIQLINTNESNPDLRYHAYHSSALCDEPANLHVLTGPAIALTAMPRKYARIRLCWLREHAPAVRKVLFRPDGNHESSVVFKQRALMWLRAQSINPEIAYDDREDIVEMYRRNGIKAEVLKIHSEVYPT